MPLMYPPTIHGVEKVTANFRGQMGSSLAIDLHFGDGADTVTQAVFFPPHAEDEARRVVAALNGKAPAVSVGGLLAACEALLASHVSLVGSGDCGKWDVEKEDEVVAARAAIAAARAEAGL